MCVLEGGFENLRKENQSGGVFEGKLLQRGLGQVLLALATIFIV